MRKHDMVAVLVSVEASGRSVVVSLDGICAGFAKRQ
jgi:hypothetical protein